MLFLYGILFFYIAYGMLLLRRDLQRTTYGGWHWYLTWPYQVYKHF